MYHEHAQRTLLLIAGMRDNRAREEIAGILAALRGVLDVDVNLIRSNAIVRHDDRCDLRELCCALERAGYAVHDKAAAGGEPRRHTTHVRGGKAVCSNCKNCKRCVAEDVMTSEPVCVEPSTSIRELAQIFEVNEISGVPVVDGAGKVIGVVSKTDLIRRCSEGVGGRPPSYLFEAIFDDAEGVTTAIPEQLICVGDFMSSEPATVKADAPVRTVARMMSERRIHRVIVVDDEGNPLGIVTTLDVLKAFPD
jgi:CBS domain-containing protein